jgi:hypothetical protein
MQEVVQKLAIPEEISSLLQKIGTHRVWLIGGMVYRTMAAVLYGSSMPDVDYDFLVDTDVSKVPDGWQMRRNRYGNPKFTKSDLEVDIVPLHTVHSILMRGLEPTIENYLSGTPLTVQSIAYALNEQKILGSVGMQAVLSRTVAVNNTEQLIYCAQKIGLSARELLEQKAQSMGFTAQYE